MEKNLLYYGDNFDILRDHIADESIDLIYLDPPFNSKRNYNVIYDGSTAQAEAFKDTWSLKSWQDEKRLIFEDEQIRYSKIHDVIDAFEKLLLNSDPSLFAYLVNMAIRVVEMHRVLKNTGSLYLHCDPTASHYLKIILDNIFKSINFCNELIWSYKRYTAVSNRFQRLHDTILFYQKGKKATFNETRVDYGTKSGTADSHYKVDENGKWYRWQKRKGEKPYKIYLSEGRRLGDVWEIPIINASAKERLGYPTQKPEAVLERIIQSSSNEGDIILDPCCGCGTTIAVAQKLKRRWIGIDITFLAIDLIKERLLDHYYRSTLSLNETQAKAQFEEEVTIFGIPKDLQGARQLARKTLGDRTRKEFEKWAIFSVGGIYSEIKGADAGIDGYFYINALGKGKEIERIKCPIQVKSGKVGVRDIRDFSHVADREGAPIGIFLTLELPTKPMYDEIDKMPKVKLMTGQNYSKIIIIGAQDIIDNNLPNLPIQRATKKAGRVKNKEEQGDLF